ncbi:MAG: CerR family C-terminal domain-containing protein [Sneathiella sp.]|nr:CerR family C-terminal domain-containing protein [Sneathiella sp.]
MTIDPQIPASDRLIDAAGKLFADRSFDAVSTREIAKVAGVNLSAISYHFDSKEGLYRAIFEKIVRDLKPVRVNFGHFLQTEMNKAGNDRRVLAKILARFIASLLDSIMAPENPRWRMRLIVREIQKPTDCFHIVLDGHINVMHDLVGILIAKILGEPVSSEHVRLTTQSLLMLCLQYALNEELVKARLGWRDIGPREIDKIRKSLTEMALRAVGLGEYIGIVEEE